MAEAVKDAVGELLPGDAVSIDRFLSLVREPIRVALQERTFSVFGDVDRCSPYNGSLYVTLIDKGDRYTYMLKVFLSAAVLKAAGVEVQKGSRILVTGKVGTTKIGNELQLNGSFFADVGIGGLVSQIEKWKKQYAGLFGRQKRMLPVLCLRIGVISNEDTQGFVDLSRHLGFGELVLRKTKMQGGMVAEDVAGAIRSMGGEGYDCICIVRGGGAFTDLFEFNKPVLLEAIASSPVPVVTAIGHESDVLLADLCADISMGTPTALGKMLSDRFEGEIRDCGALRQSIAEGVVKFLDSEAVLVRMLRSEVAAELARAVETEISYVVGMVDGAKSFALVGIEREIERVRNLRASVMGSFVGAVGSLEGETLVLRKEILQWHEAWRVRQRLSKKYRLVLIVCGVLGAAIVFMVFLLFFAVRK